MSNIVIFGATQSGKTTLLGYLATAMLRHPQLNDEILQKLKLIRKLTINDEFHIGNPYNPINVTKGIILPSFVSLDKDELRKFVDGSSSEGTTKRIHRKQLTICVSERNDVKTIQNENANVPCTFIDIPGFRQRLSDKYRGFYEGDVGIAVLKLQELLELWDIIQSDHSSGVNPREEYLERRLFEPIRVWCDYRSASRLVIVISQIDQYWDQTLSPDAAFDLQKNAIEKSIECVRLYTQQFCKHVNIPIAPISITLSSESNTKKHYRMAVFFRRQEENIYIEPVGKKMPGDGTLIQCLNRVMPPYESSKNRTFSMASVNKPMRAIVNNSPKTALNVRALHGSIHKYDRIYLGPIIDKRTQTVLYAECEASSLKADGTLLPSDILLEGNVGGIIFKSIKDISTNTEYHMDSSSKKSDISILKSTILYSDKIKCGDILELELRKDDYYTTGGSVDEIYSKILPSLMPFDEFSLFWYGKMVTVNIVETTAYEDRYRLSVIVANAEQKSTRHFALPSYENNTLKHHDNVLMVIPQSFYSSRRGEKEIYTYVNAAIVDIKNSHDFNAIEICANCSMDLDVLFTGSLFFEQRIMDEDTDAFLIPVCDPHKNISINSVLTKIKKNIKGHFGREVYRDFGGVRMRLIKDTSSE